MLNSVSYMQIDIDSTLLFEIWSEIEKLSRYFYKFARDEAPEAMQAVLMHALSHYKSEKGTINAYVKKLARTIVKSGNREITIEFLEETLEDGEEYLELSDNTTDNALHSNSSSDFSDRVIQQVDSERYRRRDIVEYVLSSMDKFLILCEAILRRDTTTTYYPDAFIKETLKLSGKYENFNDICLEIYMEFSNEIRWFLDLDNSNSGSNWKEADYYLIKSRESKRISFINEFTDEPVLDADIEKFKIKGNLSTSKSKRIFKVPYSDIWNMLCDLIDDTETNELKYIIDSSYIVRTLGGSIQLNADLYNMYDLIRNEIVTNILLDTGCRLVNVGSENIYLMFEGDIDMKIPKRTIKGMDIQFEVIDITDTILQ